MEEHIWRWLARAEERLCRALEYVTGFLFGAMLVLVLAQVVARYIMSQPLTWSEEALRYLLVWTTFFGASVAMKRRAHLLMELNVVRLLPQKIAKYVKLLVSASILVLLLVIFNEGVRMCKLTAGSRAVSFPIPLWVVFGIVPLSTLFMVFFLLLDTGRQWHEASHSGRGGV